MGKGYSVQLFFIGGASCADNNIFVSIFDINNVYHNNEDDVDELMMMMP